MRVRITRVKGNCKCTTMTDPSFNLQTILGQDIGEKILYEKPLHTREKSERYAARKKPGPAVITDTAPELYRFQENSGTVPGHRQKVTRNGP